MLCESVVNHLARAFRSIASHTDWKASVVCRAYLGRLLGCAYWIFMLLHTSECQCIDVRVCHALTHATKADTMYPVGASTAVSAKEGKFCYTKTVCRRFQANKLYHIHSDYLFTELLLLRCDMVHGNENENRRTNEKHNSNNDKAVHGDGFAVAHCIWRVDTSMSTFTRRWCVLRQSMPSVTSQITSSLNNLRAIFFIPIRLCPEASLPFSEMLVCRFAHRNLSTSKKWNNVFGIFLSL